MLRMLVHTMILLAVVCLVHAICSAAECWTLGERLNYTLAPRARRRAPRWGVCHARHDSHTVALKRTCDQSDGVNQTCYRCDWIDSNAGLDAVAPLDDALITLPRPTDIAPFDD